LKKVKVAYLYPLYLLILWLNLQLCSSTISEQQFSILASLMSCGTDEPLPEKYNSGTI
jgi:hypothetical protein